jgi:hypothetical protein
MSDYSSYLSCSRPTATASRHFSGIQTTATVVQNEDISRLLLIQKLQEKERRTCENLLEYFLAQNDATQRKAVCTVASNATCGMSLMALSPSHPTPSTSPGSQGFSPPLTPSCHSQDEDVQSRPHPCHQCGKRFRFKSNLFEHKSLHQKTPNVFSCPFCSKTCRLKGNLKKHLQTHVGTPEALERLWKERFSRSSGRPKKLPHAD